MSSAAVTVRGAGRVEKVESGRKMRIMNWRPFIEVSVPPPPQASKKITHRFHIPRSQPISRPWSPTLRPRSSIPRARPSPSQHPLLTTPKSANPSRIRRHAPLTLQILRLLVLHLLLTRIMIQRPRLGLDSPRIGRGPSSRGRMPRPPRRIGYRAHPPRRAYTPSRRSRRYRLEIDGRGSSTYGPSSAGARGAHVV